MYIQYNKDKEVKSIYFGNINFLREDVEYISVRSGLENIQKNREGIYELKTNNLFINEQTKDAEIFLDLL